MKLLKRTFPVMLLLILVTTAALAQIKDVGLSPDVVVDQPSWIENPVGSIIGLIVLIAMFAGTAKVALAKD